MHDVIVLGTGGVGSAAVFHAAQRGLDVLGLDRFPPGHDRGSSHGQTRMIRMSYFEHPDYVPLLRSAYRLWDELGILVGEQLFHRTGLLYFGDPNGVVMSGLKASAREHELTIDSLTEAECRKRFPAYTAPSRAEILLEPDAGYLLVEDCVKAHLTEAARSGAEHRYGETVLSWTVDHDSVVVRTDQQSYRAQRLIITAGSWTSGFLEELNVPLRILRKHLHWYTVEDDKFTETAGCPCFFYEAEGGMFYGFPDIDGGGLKVAEHSGGAEIADPLTDPREEEPKDTRRIQRFMQTHLPGVSMNRTRHEVCFYTMSPDENFIVDRHPDHPNVSFAAGLSGHGFKFASALGKTLVELVVDGETVDDVGFLGLGRPALSGRKT